METSKKLNKTLLVLVYALLVVATGLCIYLLVDKSISYPIGLIAMNLASVTVAFAYFIVGYTKDAAKYFKLAMLFDAATYVLNFLYLAIFPFPLIVDPNIFISVTLIMIMYGNSLIIAIAKDLGKKASYLIYGTNTFLYLVNLILTISEDKASLIMAIVWLIISVVGLVMIKAKYIDKANRNAQ